ncbi:DUF1835 domain-containing protein [Paenibacillus turpanensis]|uniref:DUF1835 domain-containing protein n=1 Tax=Paenibacillus turpanensis TaxID=2689078 RepID=UPI001FB57635|nr:DUF1835 domain-containing protein [Paenibacillus turpanensis]
MKELVEMKMAVDQLEVEETRQYLRYVLLKIGRLKKQEEPLEAVGDTLIELYDSLMSTREKRTVWDPVPDCTHVHIVVGDSFSGGMKQALKKLGWADQHKLIPLRENYAIGPLTGLNSLEGRKARADWFRDNISEAFESYTDFEEDFQELLAKVENIPEQAQVVLWASGNACEQTGMRHAIQLLRRKRNPICVYDAAYLSSKMDSDKRQDVEIDSLHSGELSPDKLTKALQRMDGSGNLSESNIQRLEEEWQDISRQEGVLRIWQDQKLVEVKANYFDSYLLEKLDKLRPPAAAQEFLAAPRLIGEAIGYCDQYVGDTYFEYRLRELIYDGILEIKGVPAAMRFYRVRRKQRKLS